jgi:hypothetical protein
MHQLDIFEVLDNDWKEFRIDEVLSLINQHEPNFNVAAVYIYPEECGGAEPAFAILEENKYKIFNFWHGMLIKQNFIIKDDLPNNDWILIN